MGAVGVAGFLAACGSDEPATSAETSEPAETPGPSEASEPAETPGAGESGSGSAGGEALTGTGDVPVGGGVILDSAGVVVTQPTAGEFVAFSAICTHQGCAVTEVADGLITCTCHGSQFSAADGSVEQGPAEQPLPPVAIVVESDQIFSA